jgi:hypothetical protein
MKKTKVYKIPNSINFVFAIILLYTSFPIKVFTQSKKLVAESSFEILSEGMYKTTEHTFQFIHMGGIKGDEEYLAKFKKTLETDMMLFNKQSIEVKISPLVSPEKVIYTLKQNCDKLELFYDYYKTTNYGCCADNDYLKIYDYNNKLMLEGTDKIYKGEYGNNEFFYFSYHSPLDSARLGLIKFWFSDIEKYTINLKAKMDTQKDGEELCPVIAPIVSINLDSTSYGFDDEDTYQFYYLDNAKSTSEINLPITFTFDCDPRIVPIKIPIMNGKPFGKRDKNQTYIVEYK